MHDWLAKIQGFLFKYFDETQNIINRNASLILE